MTNWGDMPPELKWMIVDRMDIITRFRLKMCSKSDKCLVDTVPFHCDYVISKPNMFREQNKFWEFRTEDVRVRWDEDTTTLAIRRENKERYYKPPFEPGKERFIKLSSAEEGPEMIRCMFRAFMLPQNARITSFSTSLNLDYLFPEWDIKLHVKQLHLAVENRPDNKEWLDVLAKPPELLSIRYGWDGIESHPMVQNVNNLRLEDPADVENEHLMNFKATNMHIYSSKVTEEGINAYIKKLINDDYPIKSRMDFRRDVNSTWDKIIDGLDYTMIRNTNEESDNDWTDDEDEEEEAGGDNENIEELDADVDNNAQVDMDEDIDYSDDEEEERKSGHIEARVNMSSQKDIIVKLDWYTRYGPSYHVYLHIVKKGEISD